MIASTSSHYVRSGLVDQIHHHAINIPLVEITREVHASVDEAREGFRETFDENKHEQHCTCRHQAILAVISDRIARRTRRTWDEMMKINCQQLTRFLSQRS